MIIHCAGLEFMICIICCIKEGSWWKISYLGAKYSGGGDSNGPSTCQGHFQVLICFRHSCTQLSRSNEGFEIFSK